MTIVELLIQVNWISITLASSVAIGFGAVWYSPLLFEHAWMESASLSRPDLAQVNIGRLALGGFIVFFVIATHLACEIGGNATPLEGVRVGIGLGVRWTALPLMVIALLEQRGIRYVVINAGYVVCTLAAMGLILGAW